MNSLNATFEPHEPHPHANSLPFLEDTGTANLKGKEIANDNNSTASNIEYFDSKLRGEAPQQEAASMHSTDLPYHPFADIFPLLEGGEDEALVDSIEKNGIREPIVLYEGKNPGRAYPLPRGTQTQPVAPRNTDPEV